MILWRRILRGDSAYLSVKLFAQPLYLLRLIWLDTAALRSHARALFDPDLLLSILWMWGNYRLMLNTRASWVILLLLSVQKVGVWCDSAISSRDRMAGGFWSLLLIDRSSIVVVWRATARGRGEGTWFLCTRFLVMNLLHKNLLIIFCAVERF